MSLDPANRRSRDQAVSPCRMASNLSSMTTCHSIPIRGAVGSGRCGILRPMRRAMPGLSLVLAVLLAAGCVTVAAPDPSANAIVVNGTGRIAVAPDTALLTLGVESQAAGLAEATSDAARR